MEILEKIEIVQNHFVTDFTYIVLQNQNSYKLEPLDIFKDLVLSFRDEDLNFIKANNIFLSVIFSPASISKNKILIPLNSQIIAFDYNILVKYSTRERIATLLHEYGHAFNPNIKGNEGEFTADDFAIERGYGKEIKELLERNKLENPREFDKEITNLRIERINKMEELDNSAST